MIDWMGQERLRCVFDIIKLWEIPAPRALDTPYADLWPLSGMMAQSTVDSIVVTAERSAASPASPQERSDLSALLALLARVRLPAKDE